MEDVSFKVKRYAGVGKYIDISWTFWKLYVLQFFIFVSTAYCSFLLITSRNLSFSPQCNMCSRSFADFGSHRRHVRLHTNDNPFKCHVCSKEFSRSDSYKNHLHTHAQKKPFKCETCEKTFAYASTYKRHLNAHWNGKKFSCDVCSKSFSRQDYLACHVKIHGKRKRRDSNTSLDSEINITESELMLNTEIDRSTSFSVNDDLFPIPILLSMAESAVVNVNMCDDTSCIDSSTVELTTDNEIELGPNPDIPNVAL